LLGIKCRYDGTSKPNEQVIDLAKKEVLIPICPEQLGGQPTPRRNAEIVGGDGADVLDKKSKVLEPDGTVVTSFFVAGAEETLRLAKMYNCTEAILKQRSPSCGSGQIYDGTFQKKTTRGDGVTAALLKRNGIRVISEEEL
jgi:uncharacterized protein YbbK (DUF523 family)